MAEYAHTFVPVGFLCMYSCKHTSTIADTQTDWREMGYHKRLRQCVFVYMGGVWSNMAGWAGIMTQHYHIPS